MNNLEALCRMFAWQHWLQVHSRSKIIYGPGLLKKGFEFAEKGLNASPRKQH